MDGVSLGNMATNLQPPPNVGQDVNSRQWKDWLYSIYSAISTAGGLGTMASQNANNVVISGGTIGGVALSGDSINNTPIGAITPSTGAFTTLSIGTPLGIASGGTNASTASGARTNLGVTATGTDTTYAYRANNLSDLGSASTARTNLGLGTIATQNTGLSVTITTAKLTLAGANGSMTFTNGILTSQTQAT